MHVGKFIIQYVIPWAAFALLTSPALGRPQSSTASSAPSYSFGPLTDYTDAQPKLGDVLWFRRGERYNIHDPSIPELKDQTDPDSIIDDTGNYYHDPMPFKTSDAVVVAHIRSGQAYLSNDKRDFYSEFVSVLDEVLRSPTSRFLRSGDAIDVERKGREIRLPDGKIVKRG